MGLPTGRFPGLLRKSFVAVASCTFSKESNSYRGVVRVTKPKLGLKVSKAQVSPEFSGYFGLPETSRLQLRDL